MGGGVTRDWRVICKDCGKPFAYSDTSAREAIARGDSRPERCLPCRQRHNRQTARMGAAYLDLDPGTRPVAAGQLKAGRLGRLDRGPRRHEPAHRPVPATEPGMFGITDDHMRGLLATMAKHQVVVVHAPTGSGKSTFLPWRLLDPPDPYPQDAVTRHGLIVVTQPRIEATQGIPRFLASKLHGASVGAGVDIGFRHSKARDRADLRNRLVFATDGTLLNMIRRGELFSCSTVIIDEAHERSLNIDLILALMRRQLIMLPQLRLLIVSATIDTEAFADFFRPEISADVIPMPGKEGKPVFDRWREAAPIPETQWAARMPGEVAQTAFQVCRWMAAGERPADVPAEVPTYQGDILAFLPGRRAINAAIDELTDLLSDDDLLADSVEVLPLYAQLSQGQRDRVLKPEGRREGVRWRVIVSTNIAETSLTVDGVCHVIDSGLINSTEWDSSTLTTVVRPKPHSQSGLRQRRGRAGRTAPGVWHCLFTKEQFDRLESATPPEIVRAPLERVVLTASAAGVSDPASLRWLAPGPPPEEMRRAMATLRGMGAIDADGDPTAFGSELAASVEAFDAASLLMCADEAGVAIEAATVLAALRGRRWVNVLRWSTAWPAITRLHADRLHSALLSECRDDLDATLMLVHLWEVAAQDERSAIARRHLLSADAMRAILDVREQLLRSLQSRTKTVEVRAVEPGLADRLRRVIAWSTPNALYRHHDGSWEPTVVPRADADVVARLHQGARPELDSDTLLARIGRTPRFLAALARERRRRWISPFQEPQDQVTLSFCVSLEQEHLAEDVPLLVHVAGHGRTDAVKPPIILPGERILVEPVGAGAGGTRVRVLGREEPLVLPDLELDAPQENENDDSGDLEERERIGPDSAGLAGDSETAADFLSPETVRPGRGDTPLDDGGADPFAQLDIVTADLDLQHPVLAVTEVTAGSVRVEPDPVAAVARFAAAFEPGSQCTVVVDEVRTLSRDRSRILIAREVTTGVRLPLTGIELGFGVRYNMLSEDKVGTRLRLAVVATDAQAGLVLLSALPWTAAALTRIASGGTEPYSGRIVDAADEKVWLTLEPDGRRVLVGHPPIAFEVRANCLPLRPSEMVIGQTVRMVPYRPGQRRATADLDLQALRLPSGPFQQRGKTITLDGPVTPSDILAIYGAAKDMPLADQIAVSRAVGLLVARALRQRFRVIDTTGLTMLTQRAQWPATVIASNPERITVLVDGGLSTSISTPYLAWPGQPTPTLAIGEPVHVFVGRVDVEQGWANLSLRDPATDPFRLVSVDRVHEGVIVSTDTAGWQVSCPDLPAAMFVPASETLTKRSDTEFVPGAAIVFRVISVDVERRSIVGSRALVRIERSLPGDLLRLLQSDKGTDANRLRPLVGQSPHLRVEAGGRLIMRWADGRQDVPWQQAERSVDAVITGMLTEVSVPFIGPLTDVSFREELGARSGAVMRHDKMGTGPGSSWRTTVIHPGAMSADEILARISARFPHRIRATGLQCSIPNQFVAAQRAFKDAERARGREGSRLTFRRPYNYVDIGQGDSWDQFAQRLNAYGLTLIGPQWILDDRIEALSSRPVR
jgi:HrpA-like RNA helicase